jgi:hypothetical protein
MPYALAHSSKKQLCGTRRRCARNAWLKSGGGAVESLAGLRLSKSSTAERHLLQIVVFFFASRSKGSEMFCIVILSTQIPAIVEMYLKIPNFMSLM